MPNPTVLTDAVIKVDGTALSSWANKVTLSDEADQVEITGFSSNAYRSYTMGLKKASIGATFFQEFAAAGGTAPDALLSPLYYSGGTFTVTVLPSSGGTSATNPAYYMTARLYSWSPLDGGVGDASTIDVTFENASSAGLTKATAYTAVAP